MGKNFNVDLIVIISRINSDYNGLIFQYYNVDLLLNVF